MLLRRKWLSLLNPTQAFSLVLSTLVAHTMMPTLATADELQDLPDEQRLLAKLLHNYNSNVRPVINSSHSVEVVFGFSLIQIMDMVSILVYHHHPSSIHPLSIHHPSTTHHHPPTIIIYHPPTIINHYHHQSMHVSINYLMNTYKSFS